MKIKKALKAFVEIAKNPWLLNKVLDDDLVWKKYLANKYNLKNGLPVVDINLVCPNFSERLEYFGFLGGGSLPTDLALLKSLSKQIKDCSYFEIGTWRGESVINVAENAKECYTLNLSKKEILELGLGEQYADLHGFFSKGKSNIHHLTGNSLSYDYAGLDKKFDLIFIDGNHHFDFVKSDTQKVFEHLIHEETIIVWHDYAYTPEKYRPEVMAAIVEGTPLSFRKHLYHVSNTMCAIFIRKEFRTTQLENPLTPKRIFQVSIENKKL